MTHYRQYREQILSGAILLFSGQGFISDGIKDITNSPWSHIGLAFWSQQFDEWMLCVWESTTLGNVADIDGRFKKGVQTVSLSSRLSSYNGKVVFRNPDRELTSDEFAILARTRKEFQNRPYERSKLELVKSAFDLPDWMLKNLHFNQEDLSSLFCSELAAEAFQRIGFLPHAYPSNEYTPADFASGGTVDERLYGIKFGPEITLKEG